ncbi:class I SAM-dependent methyltransferase family protein [Candidatus Woesearchaeota archaeon]|nr:class I SAM-dependent methyltransferase family protein [Candidatus Woesearchaeota archaeon]
MLAAFTSLQNAQRVKEYLIAKNLINKDYLAMKEMGSMYFPIVKKVTIPNATVVDTKFAFPQKKKEPTIEDVLKDTLTPKEITLIPQSQEVVGSILILEIPDELKTKEKIIAQAYLQVNKHLTTVVGKDKIHSGEYRTRTVRVLAGKRSKETIHTENGVKIKLHLEKVYFSARSANERLRIAKLVKPHENVLVMFSGAGPFPLVIAKHSAAQHVWGIELNPFGHQYALENVMLNHLENRITLLQGDVRFVLPKIKESFHRIAMPLPKTGELFLPIALPKVKVGGMIHLYAFLDVDDFETERTKVLGICKDSGYKVNVNEPVKCGQFAPRVFRVCFDITRTK